MGPAVIEATDKLSISQDDGLRPFGYFPPELIAHIILQGSNAVTADDLTASYRSPLASESRSFLRAACLTSKSWHYLAHRLLLSRPYLFGEYAVASFLQELEKNAKDDNRMPAQVERIEMRMKGKFGHTAAVEKVLEGVHELKALVIDGGEEGYSILGKAQQDKWLRKAINLESLSLYHVSHLLESSSLSDTALPALSLPNLRSLSITTTSASSSTIALIEACTSLAHLTLVDRDQLDFVSLQPVMLGKKDTLRSLRLKASTGIAGDQLTAARRIVSQCASVDRLGVDVAAILQKPSPLSEQLQHLALFDVAGKCDKLSRARVVEVVTEGVKHLRVLQVARSIWSEELAKVCEMSRIQLLVD